MNRREFIRLMGLAGAAGLVPTAALADRSPGDRLYNRPMRGNVRLMHITDTHAQLLPVYFREPNVNMGFGYGLGKAPHLVGRHFLNHFGIAENSIESHAFTYLGYEEAAQRYGKVGGFAHLKTLVEQLRAEAGDGNSLLLDGGDTWQGSGTAYKTRGMDMVKACNHLGVDVMTGHWEYTYLDHEVLANIEAFNGDFVAQNVRVRDEALFDYRFAEFDGFNEDSGHAFKPYVIKQVNGARIAVIGQAFPYTPIANPSRFMPDWSFGIRDDMLQELVDEVRECERPDAVILLSHNGMDVDLKMASVVSGVDVIFGGHTHDGMPLPTVVKNAGGKTLVTNAGSNGKFVGVMDLDIRNGKVQGFDYSLLPVFSNLLDADPDMSQLIREVRKPHQAWLGEELAMADQLLYRRGNFNGTFDQIICDALNHHYDSQVSLSPGFRWGTSILPGQQITMEHVLDQTCITYPETYAREMKGEDIKLILEDVCDNLFNTDPYYQQGGDMVRVGGLDYICDPTASIGKRISEMTLDNGERVEAGKHYKVSGWATVGSQSPGPVIWDVVAGYLREQKVARVQKFNVPRLRNASGNPGVAHYPGKVVS